jgi:hypothetical protein
MAPKPLTAPVCPKCGKPAARTDTGYGPRFDCCGMRAWGDKPLATRDTLRARSAAHAAFDPIWREGHLTRSEAYRMLSERLGIPYERTHMATMDEALALRVPAAAEAIRATLRGEAPVGDEDLAAEANLPRP